MVVQSHARGESNSSFNSEFGNDAVIPLIEESETEKWDASSEIDVSFQLDVNRNNWTRVKRLNLQSSYQVDERLYPKEKGKTLLTLLFMGLMFLVNTASIALTHDRVPDRASVPPLPDIVLDSITPHPELMHVPDVLVMIALVLGSTLILLHQYRWILARRIFFIVGVLYLMRSITMYVTVLPVANHTVYCAPKTNSTSFPVIAHRVWELLVGGGMQISGMKKSCGDYIYSGHTVMLVLGMLIFREYSPQRLWFMHWLTWGMAWVGMGILLLARGHYTIDVLIGYYAATRMFWAYHTLANNHRLKIKSSTNYHSEVWWFRIFQFLEVNVGGPLPNRYSLPIWIPPFSTSKQP